MTPSLAHYCLTPLQKIIYRPLTADDFQAYKDLRVEALTSVDNRFFVESSKPEQLRTDDEWRNVCEETFDRTGRGLYVGIGAFYQGEQGENLIGSAFAEQWDKDKTGNTAYYRAIYVTPDFRESGVGEKIERLLDVWAVKHNYTKSIFTVRADKEKWLARQIKVFGGSIVKTKMVPYANGEMAETHYLERTLCPPTAAPTLPLANNRRIHKLVSNRTAAIAA